MIDTTLSNTIKILIVEDDPILGEMIEDAVTRKYERVTLINSAEQIMHIIEEKSIDLILLDLMLPGVDGFDALQTIRRHYSGEEVSVIIMSAIDDADSIVHGFEYGANDYIVKPIEISVLLARVATQAKLIRLQAEHRDYIENLEKGDKLSKQLNQIASHDLKNPLHNLRIAEELLREETNGNARVQQLLNTVNASLDMMEQVVGSFLDMVAIQTRSLQLKENPVLIRDIVNNAYTQYELIADKKNIKMSLGDTDGIVIADPGRMAQIAGNLVSNAIKYSPPDSEIHTWSSVHDGILRLSVADSGKGVPEEERHLLFTEFGRLSTRPTAGEGSTGLGLWIVRHLIEMQGGRAGADFPNEGGSIFWIELPVADEDDLD